jgi:hypothetical protein
VNCSGLSLSVGSMVAAEEVHTCFCFIYFLLLMFIYFYTMSCLFFKKMYDDYMLCKVTLGVLKGASKLNVLLLLLV